MKIFKLIALSLMAFLVACGGGGGDPGTPASGGGTGSGGTGVVNWYDTILSVVLKNPNDSSAESIAAGGGSVLEATLTTNTGKPVAGQVVTIYNSTTNDLMVRMASRQQRIRMGRQA